MTPLSPAPLHPGSPLSFPSLCWSLVSGVTCVVQQGRWTNAQPPPQHWGDGRRWISASQTGLFSSKTSLLEQRTKWKFFIRNRILEKKKKQLKENDGKFWHTSVAYRERLRGPRTRRTSPRRSLILGFLVDCSVVSSSWTVSVEFASSWC